jgi:hypothetical protein
MWFLLLGGGGCESGGQGLHVHGLVGVTTPLFMLCACSSGILLEGCLFNDGQEEVNLALETLGRSSVHELFTCLNVSRLVMSLECDLDTSAARTSAFSV